MKNGQDKTKDLIAFIFVIIYTVSILFIGFGLGKYYGN